MYGSGGALWSPAASIILFLLLLFFYYYYFSVKVVGMAVVLICGPQLPSSNMIN